MAPRARGATTTATTTTTTTGEERVADDDSITTSPPGGGDGDRSSNVVASTNTRWWWWWLLRVPPPLSFSTKNQRRHHSPLTSLLLLRRSKRRTTVVVLLFQVLFLILLIVHLLITIISYSSYHYHTTSEAENKYNSSSFIRVDDPPSDIYTHNNATKSTILLRQPRQQHQKQVSETIQNQPQQQHYYSSSWQQQNHPNEEEENNDHNNSEVLPPRVVETVVNNDNSNKRQHHMIKIHDVWPPPLSHLATTTTTTNILNNINNISTYEDLFDILDTDNNNPHYCGYMKCFYVLKGQNQPEIGLLVTQDDAHTRIKTLNTIEYKPITNITVNLGNVNGDDDSDMMTSSTYPSYYDILLQTYQFSKQLEIEFPNNQIRNLLLGPPIRLDTKPNPKELKYLNTKGKQRGWYGNDDNRWEFNRKYHVIVQPIYSLVSNAKIKYMEIRVGPYMYEQKYIEKLINKVLKVNNIVVNQGQQPSSLTKIQQKLLQSFVKTFEREIQIMKKLLEKYPQLSEDLQFYVDTTGRIYQTDLDRIYFIYGWAVSFVDNNKGRKKKKNEEQKQQFPQQQQQQQVVNHSKMVEFVLPFLDQLILDSKNYTSMMYMSNIQ